MKAVRKFVVVVVDAASRKSRLFENEFVDVELDGEHYSLVVFDPPGSPTFDGVRRMGYLYASIVLLCYSLHSRQSLNDVLERWRRDIDAIGADPAIPVVVVADTANLHETSLRSEGVGRLKEDELILSETGLNIAEEIGAIKYAECSTKTKQGIPELLKFVAKTSVLSAERSSVPERTGCRCCNIL